VSYKAQDTGQVIDYNLLLLSTSRNA